MNLKQCIDTRVVSQLNLVSLHSRLNFHDFIKPFKAFLVNPV